ncbi:Heterokaryon incompatibility protein (HET) domain containing protein [Naviculisporaceae sp. PSN 640]
MEIRWHSPDCTNPDVTAVPGPESPGLVCNSCNCTPPNPQSLHDEMVSSNGLPQLPPDEPLGNLQLSWPSRSYYSYSKSPELASSIGSPISSTASLQSLSTASEKPDPVTSDPIYAQSVGQDQIRLLKLFPSTSPSVLHPYIHLRLDIYPDDFCPEYEAVSYTWADEDGDFTLKCPVYVGPFWDILLVTNNCHAMLHYMRRSLVPRLLWVDAICINQSGDAEKSTQIPKMGTIYNNAMRVVVFLDGSIGNGENVEPEIRPRKHITSSAARHEVESMLSHEYFSRLWVIQELMLARAVVFAFRGVEYQADAVSASRAHWPSSPGGSPAVPWLRLMCQQSFASQGGLGAALQLTGQARCRDIRDKLFGILGLIGDAKEAAALRIDYSISSRHLLVGLFTHYVFKKRMVDHVLRNAVGIYGWEKQPSWVPTWRTTPPTTLGRPPYNEGKYRYDPSPPNIGADVPFFNKILPGMKDLAIRIVTWEKIQKREIDDTCLPLSQRPSINAATGGLTLYMIHLCRIRVKPEFIQHVPQKVNTESLFLFNVRAANSAILLYAYDENLDSVWDAKNDYIMFANMGGPVIVRATNETQYCKTIAPLHSVWVTSRHQELADRSIEELIRIQCLDSLIKTFPSMNLASGSLEDPYLENIFPRYYFRRITRIAERLRRQVFPGATTALDTLEALSSLPGWESGKLYDLDPLFFPPFIKVNGKHRVVDSERLSVYQSEPPKCIEFKFEPHEFELVKNLYLDPLYSPEEEPLQLSEEGMFHWGVPRWELKEVLGSLGICAPAESDWVNIGSCIRPGSDKDMAFARACVQKKEGSVPGNDVAIHLRTEFIPLINTLEHDWWETAVLRRLEPLQYYYAKPVDDKPPTRYELLKKGNDKAARALGIANRFRILRQPRPKTWPYYVISEHRIDCKPMCITIL